MEKDRSGSSTHSLKMTSFRRMEVVDRLLILRMIFPVSVTINRVLRYTKLSVRGTILVFLRFRVIPISSLLATRASSHTFR